MGRNGVRQHMARSNQVNSITEHIRHASSGTDVLSQRKLCARALQMPVEVQCQARALPRGVPCSRGKEACTIDMASQEVTVRMMFGSTIQQSHGEHVERKINVASDDSLLVVKQKISVSIAQSHALSESRYATAADVCLYDYKRIPD